jgi:oxazoline/thiazoline synthase
MIQHPRVKSKYHVETVEGEGIYLLSENEKHVLEGETMFRLVPLLDGRRGWAEIMALLVPHVGEEAARAGVEVLLRNGHIENAVPEQFGGFDIFWSELGISPQDARAKLAAANCQVLGFGAADAQAVTLGLLGIGVRHDPHRAPTMLVAVTDDYQHPGLAELNAHALARKLPWLLLKPQGLEPLVGPMFQPHESACHACLNHWLNHNREVEGYVLRRAGRSAPLPLTKARVPLGEAQALSVALLQVARWIVRGDCPVLQGRVLAIDTLSGGQQHHPANRRPQCPACGTPAVARRAGAPVVLADPQHAVANENGVRPEEPEVTFARYEHLVSPLTGVVKGIYPSPWNTAGPIRTFVAGHNFALKNDSLYFLKDGLRSNSSGKGKSAAQARTSALCEALERYSGTFRHEEETRLASFRELGEDALDPRTVMLYSDRQYAEREDWNGGKGRFQVVPDRFDEEKPIHWSPLWSWTEQRRKWIPTSLAYYGFTEKPDAFFCWGDSNGCAAGGNFEDALLQGALELVERDAVAMWWMNRASRPGLDLKAFGDPYIDGLVAFFDGIGRDVWVLDLTGDLGVPAFAAINRRRSGPSEDIIMGFGAHFDARIALNRALTEMNQFVPAVLDVGPDGNTRYAFGDPQALDWWQTATIANQPYLLPSSEPARGPDAFPVPPSGPVRELVLELFGRFEKAGHEVLVLDQTRPDIGLPVAKVIVPGLRHFWARYAPGRLYDVPVRLGWRDTPCAEAELNPIPMFL